MNKQNIRVEHIRARRPDCSRWRWVLKIDETNDQTVVW